MVSRSLQNWPFRGNYFPEKKARGKGKKPQDNSPETSTHKKFGKQNVKHLKRILYSNSTLPPPPPKVTYPLEFWLLGDSLTKEYSPHRNPPQAKILLKQTMSIYFPITNTIRKQWTNFITCKPLPTDCRGLFYAIRYNYLIFQLYWTKLLSQNSDQIIFGKNGRKRRLSCPPIFLVTQKGH